MCSPASRAQICQPDRRGDPVEVNGSSASRFRRRRRSLWTTADIGDGRIARLFIIRQSRQAGARSRIARLTLRRLGGSGARRRRLYLPGARAARRNAHMLDGAKAVAFISTTDTETARRYGTVLGLNLTQDPFALVARIPATRWCASPRCRTSRPAHPVFGFAVDDIAASARNLAAHGVALIATVPWRRTRPDGIWTGRTAPRSPGSTTRTAIFCR